MELAPRTLGGVMEVFWVVPEHLLTSSHTQTQAQGVFQMILSKAGPLAVISQQHTALTYTYPSNFQHPVEYTLTHTETCAGLQTGVKQVLLKL